MNIRSCKAKGRRLAAAARDLLLKYAPDISEQDIAITPSGVNGPDLTFSSAAHGVYPFAIECKNTESINVWKAFEQAKTHQKSDEIPLLIFSRNRSEMMVCLKFEDLLRLVR